MNIASPTRKLVAALPCALLLALSSGCASHAPAVPRPGAIATPPTAVTRDLVRLPAPRGKISVAVYGFRDQTGQYKPAPDSSFSTAVTQGAGSLLLSALQASGWFLPVERENLQDLLTERKIARALENPKEQAPAALQMPQLVPAAILLEGGITAYETNVRTGGIGANFLGIGASSQYRVDQVTISLRSVDVRSGEVLNSVSTTKTIYSYELHPSVFKFVNFKDLAQFEAGVTRNEPTQLCVREAIEAAVVRLVVQGLKDGRWQLKDEKDWSAPLIQAYLGEDGASAPATRKQPGA
jgi:curli production assembly/transport component CsgG